MGGGRSERGRNGSSEYGQPKKWGYIEKKEMWQQLEMCFVIKVGIVLFFMIIFGSLWCQLAWKQHKTVLRTWP